MKMMFLWGFLVDLNTLLERRRRRAGVHREAEEATLSTWSERPRRAAGSCNGVVQPCGTELRRRAGVWREGMEWPCTFADDTNQ